MRKEDTPVAHLRKKDGLEIHTLSGQIVIYEINSDSMHYLNPTAALVLEFCDGDRSPDEIAVLVQQAYGLAAAPAAEIGTCLADLKTSGLIG